MNMHPEQKGFTLLEVLVTIIVLSIGLLGLAGLMATGLRNTHSAYQRTQAAWLAYDVIDRMRANLTYVNAAPLPNDYDITLGTATSASSGLAAADINNWKTTLANALPAGDGSVATVSATRRVTVIIQWNDTRAGGSSTQKLQVDTQL
ncbi:MAG: type IV pilus modification protein PilV [Sulfuriferula sp.]